MTMTNFKPLLAHTVDSIETPAIRQVTIRLTPSGGWNWPSAMFIVMMTPMTV